jgi:hypothetical protein
VADQPALEDHQEVSDHHDGDADPQRPEAAKPDRPPLALVVADALVAVAAQRGAEPLAEGIVNLRGRQRELKQDGRRMRCERSKLMQYSTPVR